MDRKPTLFEEIFSVLKALEEQLAVSPNALTAIERDIIKEQLRSLYSDITIATTAVNRRDASGFGIMKVDDTNQITAFMEKPANIGIPTIESEATVKKNPAVFSL